MHLGVCNASAYHCPHRHTIVARNDGVSTKNLHRLRILNIPRLCAFLGLQCKSPETSRVKVSIFLCQTSRISVVRPETQLVSDLWVGETTIERKDKQRMTADGIHDATETVEIHDEESHHGNLSDLLGILKR